MNLPDEVRDALGSDDDYLLDAVRYLRRRGLIVFASELRDEATIERAAALVSMQRSLLHPNLYSAWSSDDTTDTDRATAVAILSAVLGSEEARESRLGEVE